MQCPVLVSLQHGNVAHLHAPREAKGATLLQYREDTMIVHAYLAQCIANRPVRKC